MQHPVPAEREELRAKSMDSSKEDGVLALHSDIGDLFC